MKTKLTLAIAAAAMLPLAGIAEVSDGQDAQLNKLLTEMNSAPADQKIGAIVTLLNKLVEERLSGLAKPKRKSSFGFRTVVRGQGFGPQRPPRRADIHLPKGLIRGG